MERCYRYPCDRACTGGGHPAGSTLHGVHAGSGKYLAPHDYAWSVSVVAEGDDGPWMLRLRVGNTCVDLEAGQEVEDLVDYVTRAALWQAKYLREDLTQELKATQLDLQDATELTEASS